MNADSAPGRFPVVLYNAGAAGSYDENFVLFEYLASHGYVVVSSAFQSPFPDYVGNNLGGIDTSGPDLNFLIEAARQWGVADAVSIAAIGSVSALSPVPVAAETVTQTAGCNSSSRLR